MAFIFFMALMFLVMAHDSVPGAAAPREYEKTACYVFALLNSFLAFREGRLWQKRGGAVEKLVPRARGRAFGCVWAAGLMTMYLLPSLWTLTRT